MKLPASAVALLARWAIRPMVIRLVVAAVAGASLALESAPAQAGLIGSTVQAASYLDVSSPPPAASPTECTIIDCNILDYQGTSGPTNSPLPIVPVTYIEDALTETAVSVGDTQITITNDLAGLFCPMAGCTPGNFSGYVFTFTGAPDITNVQVKSGSASDFQPVSLTSTADSVTVDVAGDNLAFGDELILDVTTGTTVSSAPEPASLAIFGAGLAALGWMRRKHKAS